MSEDLLTWKERCGTCAYRPGTEASRSEFTLMKANLCMDAGEVFLCHEDPSHRAICKGWVDVFAARLRSGKQPRVDPEVAKAMSEAITKAEDDLMASLSDEAKRLYEIAVRSSL